MKVKNLNLTLEWQTIRNLPVEINIEDPFPTYNVKVKNEDQIIIYSALNIDKYEPIEEIICKHSEGVKKPKFYASFSNTKANNKFIFDFKENYLKFKELNNKLGYYKKVYLEVDYNGDSEGDFTLEGEYEEIYELEKKLLFNKIYRSTDYLTVKFLINKEYFSNKEIHSLLIMSEVSNRVLKNKKLLNLFTEDVQSKWLDVNETTALLTIPFIESDIVEISENLNIQVMPLNKLQSDMYKLFKENENEIDINNFYQDFLPNQLFNIGKIYKQTSNNETVAFYQNYIYLFNKDSLETNSLQTDLSINDITFNKYLPLLKKDQINKTICLSDDLNTDDVLDNNYNLQKDYLGYYAKNLTDYEDVAVDIDYLQNQGIQSVKIVEIEEFSDTCDIYIEFMTSFYNNEKFYIETSNNLKFYEKYKTTIDDKEYITLLFKYSYNLDSLKQYLLENSNINKNQIISEKDLINFSVKLIL
jgi:hypothetical protein